MDLHPKSKLDEHLNQNARAGNSRLQIAFASSGYIDPTRIDSWSGLPYFIWHCLQKQGADLTLIPLASDRGRILRTLKFAVAKILFRKRYLRDRDSGLLRSYARQIEAALEGGKFDFLFCAGTAEIAFVQTTVPIAFWVDASFAGMLNFYDSFTRLQEISIREGNAADTAVLERATLAIYSSNWAADTARSNYSVAPNKLHVVRFGANLKDAPSTSEIQAIIDQREQETCRLLWIGVDWHRKGADIALLTLNSLEKLGVRARLTIIGCQAPTETRLPSNVEVLGFVNKGTAEGKELIERHLKESHIFFMPSRAEAYGLVFCEASAFGLPCIATDVGGVSSIVENGINGWLLPLDASADDYAIRIKELFCDRESYRTTARNGRRLFDERLNWDVAGSQVIALMRKHLEKKHDHS